MQQHTDPTAHETTQRSFRSPDCRKEVRRNFPEVPKHPRRPLSVRAATRPMPTTVGGN